MKLTKEHLTFLKRLSIEGRLTHDFLGDEINHLYPDQEPDAEAKRQCEEMVRAGYLETNGFDYGITEKGMEELRKRNLLR
ncbi:MAG: hypothetical protein RIN55_05530 [Tissierellaceae bacterium]|nr:hypothetical protein [Tissierellaceae bacterium]